MSTPNQRQFWKTKPTAGDWIVIVVLSIALVGGVSVALAFGYAWARAHVAGDRVVEQIR